MVNESLRTRQHALRQAVAFHARIVTDVDDNLIETWMSNSMLNQLVARKGFGDGLHHVSCMPDQMRKGGVTSL